MGQGFGEVFIVDPQQLHGGRGGVGQRTQDVEYRAEPQLPANGAHILHRGMVVLGEKEAESGFFQHLPGLFRILGQVHAQGFQAVGCAAPGARRTVAVLGHFHAGSCRHQGRDRGDVEGIGSVAAGSHDFKDLEVCLHRRGVFPHGSGTPGDFFRCFGSRAFGGQCCQKCGILCRGGGSVHDFIHDGICFFIREVFLVHDFFNGFADHAGSPSCGVVCAPGRADAAGAVCFRKPARMSFPRGVRMDSG